ncbi:ABC transporter permease [Phytoactinopolyspora mesophila]|uniref:ABC transporter permease subunit n=1 Tax=Phytoactinopolyspora mesophila TaxID=2650750 RepID=A0A7K3M454_9ACTN|nr:ABC transporter permease [Phytoactinopolyspora mesophila]NDL58094.1 ABC transporter permease subunit [Phytoactinopolyspora mesophila]
MALSRAVHTVTIPDNCMVRNDWVCAEYVQTRSDHIVDALREHLWITLVAVAVGFVLSFVLALMARRWRRLAALILGTSTVLYTVPSLAMFGLLLSVTGLTSTTVIVGLVLYSLIILVRGIVTGLDGIPADVREAAVGMGYGTVRMLLRVELPLALPTIIAALRVATVSTIAMTTLGVIVGHGGLGELIFSGLRSNFRPEVLTASVLVVALALTADLLLVLMLRVTTPWRRGVS